MITLTTLFDRAYLPKGQALLASIRRHAPDAAVYVLALDDETYNRLDEAPIKQIVPIRLADIESPELRRAKENRTHEEFCWTLGSYFTLWCAESFKLPSVSYIDADCFLFGPISPLYDECAKFPVSITPHRFTPSQAERLAGSGEYNVGWVHFERGGFDCLRHWRTQCLEWCKHEITADGRMGDQGYLNDWPMKWQAHVIYHLGVNLAPWNQLQYDYTLRDGRLMVSDWVDCDPLTMYHFHGFNGPHDRTGYKLHPMVAEHVYRPYERELEQWKK